MSSVSGVGSTPYFPITNQTKQPVANQQAATAPVQAVAKDADADGDNDVRKGSNIDTYA
ncbi:hypothetical protein ACH50O_02280 [Methylomonas sp. 2BW1-5-20]|uniref:hypothetical protein n=1 Tax=Methylomonas sp. 2BW1-5-20 TaxID=3376686 RepID=UPI00405240A8